MSSLLDRISELEHQLAVLKAEVEKEEKENKSTNKRWRGRCGQNYYYVAHDNSVRYKTDYYIPLDEFRYYNHNYFRTEEKAQKYANVLETERQLKKFADEHNGEIDWSKVPIDTAVLISVDNKNWFNRYFAGVNEKGQPTVFCYGATQWSNGYEEPCHFKYIKLAEVE